MAARIIKVAGLVVLAVALSAPFASAKPWVNTPALDQGMQQPSTTSTWLNTPALDQGMQVDEGTQGGAWPVTSPYLNFPALEQAIKATIVAPNDRAGTQGIGQTSPDTIGMGGQYGQNLIQQKAQDIQKAKTFKLPAPPDERPGTT